MEAPVKGHDILTETLWQGLLPLCMGQQSHRNCIIIRKTTEPLILIFDEYVSFKH
jgi:hypothetical protein